MGTRWALGIHGNMTEKCQDVQAAGRRWAGRREGSGCSVRRELYVEASPALPQMYLQGRIRSLPSICSAKLMLSYLLFAISQVIWTLLLCTCSSMNSDLLNADNLNDALKSQWNFTQRLVHI